MTQPLPPDAPCTAHRYALNTWYQGVAHPRHHCTDDTSPHPARPHLCVCGEAWAGVGITSCSHCATVHFIGNLRIESDGKGHAVYLCVDRSACAAVCARNNLAASMRTLAANSDPDVVRRVPEFPCREMPTRHCPAGYGDVCGPRPCARYESEDESPWRAELRMIHAADPDARPVESDSAAPGVPVATDGATDAQDSHVAGALGIVVSLLDIIGQADPELAPPMRTITYALGMARRELEQATAGEPCHLCGERGRHHDGCAKGPYARAAYPPSRILPPHIRQPGDPVRVVEVTGP